MFNSFLIKLRPFMDADSSVGGGAATPPEGDVTGGESGTEESQGTEDTQGTASTVTDPASQVKQTPEQNAAFAEMRRKAEAAERRAREVERDFNIAKKYGAEYGIFSESDIAAQYGQSHGIKSLVEFEAALQKQEYQAKGIDPDIINQLINEHPDVKKARELTERQELQAAQNALNSELSELSKEYPDLKVSNIEELSKLPNADKIFTLAKKGYTLIDAYESVNKAEIRKQQSEAARQATLNSISGKQHIKGNGQGSEIDTTVIPDDVLEMYKKFNPGKSIDEYKKHYKSSLGK